MLIYVSPNKISNLLTELEVKANFIDYIRSFGGNCLTIQGNRNGISINTTISYEREKKSQNIAYVLKTLRRKGKLKDLSINMQIMPLTYISSEGMLEYIGFENGYTASTLNENDLEKVRCRCGCFFDDDVLHFKIKINHELYDEIKIKCTAANIQVFGGKNLNFYYSELFKDDAIWLRSPHSGDPGILGRNLPIEFVVWVLKTDINNRTIEGSPIVLYC